MPLGDSQIFERVGDRGGACRVACNPERTESVTDSDCVVGSPRSFFTSKLQIPCGGCGSYK